MIASDNTNGTPLGFRYDADGTIWARVTFTAASTAKTPMCVQVISTGYGATALADNTNRYLLGVPDKVNAITTEGWIQVGGYCASVITPSLAVTAGDAFGITDGALVDAATAYVGTTTQFAVCATTTASVATTQNMILVPQVSLAAT